MSIEDIRRRSRVLDAKIRRQDAIMYLCGTTNIVAFGAVMWYLPQLRLVAAIVILTAVYIVYQYVRRRPARRAIEDTAAMAPQACVEFYKSALRRKRDMARQLWSWFLPPAILGQVALIVGFVVAPPNVPRRLVLLVLPFWLLTDLVVLIFGWRNAQREAKHTQREIEALEVIAKTS